MRDLDRVKLLAVQELDARDRAVTGLEIFLDDPGPVGAEIDVGRRRELDRRREAPHESAGPADVGLHDHRKAKRAGRLRDTPRIDHACGARGAYPKAFEQPELFPLRGLQGESGAAVDDGYPASLQEREVRACEGDRRLVRA